jgi:hypothetical protein
VGAIGHYGLICFFTDQNIGAPHFSKGMTLDFRRQVIKETIDGGRKAQYRMKTNRGRRWQLK